MKLELIARPGYAPTAVIIRPEESAGTTRYLDHLQFAKRLLGNDAGFDYALSTRWGCEVYCLPIFAGWWQLQESAPPPEYRIFLETLNS